MKVNNLDDVEVVASFIDILRRQRERSRKRKDLSFVLPQAANKEIPFLAANRSKTTITWIGHATFLIQISGLNILTDPVWSNRMGFVTRLAPPGIPLSEMPEIDLVLISHNHYDHLDINSLRNIKGNPRFLVPHGLSSWLRKKGFSKVSEFNWWERDITNRVEIIFVPAQHWSRRTLWDTNQSLWGSWVVKEEGQNCGGIYFVGDSGYFRGFKEIGSSFRIDYMLVPIGAYEPEWFMSKQHVTPEEAVQAYLDVGAENVIPMHYDAFRLGDDTPEEAIHRLKKEWERRKLDPAKLKIMNLGETLVFTNAI